MIGVREGELVSDYCFRPLHALVASSDSSGQLCELWHCRMAHLHHGALGGLREVVIRSATDQHRASGCLQRVCAWQVCQGFVPQQ